VNKSYEKAMLIYLGIRHK